MQAQRLCTATGSVDEPMYASSQETSSDAGAPAAPAIPSEPTSETTHSEVSVSTHEAAASESSPAESAASSAAASADPAPSDAPLEAATESQRQNAREHRKSQSSIAASDSAKKSRLDEDAVYVTIRAKGGCLQHVMPSDVLNFLQLPGLRQSDVR